MGSVSHINGLLKRAYTNPVTTLSVSDYLPLLKIAIQEDAPEGDVTSDSILSEDRISTAYVVSRERGILCGIGVLDAILELYPGEIEVLHRLEDGVQIEPGTFLCRIRGKSRLLLRLERILLNFLQYLSGISSETYRIVQKYPNLAILDTRKTIPAYRKLVKYCVYKGGGWNHRLNLSEMAMVKDNHILAAGSILSAVEKIRKKHPEVLLEIEIDRLDQLAEAIQAKPDILLLDNFSNEEIRKAVVWIREREPSVFIEVSGGITPEKLAFLSEIGSIGVSMGYLTHTTRFLDLSMEIETS